jgi:hypothetical protein
MWEAKASSLFLYMLILRVYIERHPNHHQFVQIRLVRYLMYLEYGELS